MNPDVEPKGDMSADEKDVSQQDSNIDEEQYFAAFSHPIRRKIILLCGQQEKIGFSDIKRETKASTGSIYHHLEAMAECLTQNSEKKYILTSFGYKVFEFLTQSHPNASDTPETTVILRIRNIIRKSINFFPIPQKQAHFMQNRKYTWLISHIIIFMLAGISAIFNLQAYLFFYSSGTPIWDSWFVYTWVSRTFTFFSVFIGYYLIFFILEGIFRFIYSIPNHEWRLWRKMGFVYLPITIYALILGFFKILPFNSLILNGILRITSIFFQIWALFILAEIVSNEKQVEFEQALIIALFVQYGTLILILLANIA